MSRLSLNKASLAKQSAELKRYQDFLPALDLKRQQLTAERAKARKAIEQTKLSMSSQMQQLKQQLPMLADQSVSLQGLLKVSEMRLRHENVVGVHVPVVDALTIDIEDYSFLAKPHWVDHAVALLAQALELKIEIEVLEQRVELLDQAVKKVTQRVNLFDKVLIPRARENIRKIRIYLSDAEKVGVVNAKLTKKKRLLQATELNGVGHGDC